MYSTVPTHVYVMHASTYLHKLYGSCTYRARLDELRIFLETEAWELCPVRSSFTIRKLRVCELHYTYYIQTLIIGSQNVGKNI